MIVDWSDFQYIQTLNKSWKCNQSNLVSCAHTYDDVTKEILVHDIVMALINKDKRPRLASFILEIGKERVAKLFGSV